MSAPSSLILSNHLKDLCFDGVLEFLHSVNLLVASMPQSLSQTRLSLVALPALHENRPLGQTISACFGTKEAISRSHQQECLRLF